MTRLIVARSAVVTVFAAAAVCGCGSPTNSPAPVPTCTSTGQICGSIGGTVCGTCPQDTVCATDGKSCTPLPAIGSSCSIDSECGENRECLLPANGYQTPGGYCTQVCSATMTCPSDSTCGTDSMGNSVCLADCDADAGSGCRADGGYTCMPSGTCSACVPDCAGLTCGTDGCGGTCGTMTPGTPQCDEPAEVCSSGQCTAAFVVQPEPNPDPYEVLGVWDAAAFDREGQAVIVGGREVANYPAPNGTPESKGVATLNIYDPTSDSYMSWPDPMPNPVARPNVVYFNDTNIYVVGGTDDPDVPNAPDVPETDFMEYDGTNWKDSGSSLIATMPEPSMGGGAVGLGSFIYLLPGLTCPSGSTCVNLSDYTPSSSLHSYNPGSDTWDASPSPSRPSARSFFATVTDGNRIYALGGSDGTNALGTVEIFDPSGGWTTSMPLPVPVVDPRAAISAGIIYVFGGRAGEFTGSNAIPYVQTFNLATQESALMGVTYQSLIGQAPVQLRAPGPFLLFGAQAFLPASTAPMADSDILVFNVPAQ